jgi:uncharacterized membrane protein
MPHLPRFTHYLSRLTPRWWCVVILLVAAGLRLSQLGLKSLWLDEAFAVWNAGHSPAEIWQATYDNHPPLYYLILHGWLWFGRSEFLVRLPSVFVSLITLALTYRLGRRFLGGRTAVLVVALLAFAPLDGWYAQEARMVIWVTPAALLLALGLSRLPERPGVGAMLVACGLALGLYLDYTIIPLWLGSSLIWLLFWANSGRDWRPLLAWLGGSLAGWLAFAPLWWHLGLVFGRYGEVFFVASLSRLLGERMVGVGMVIALLFLFVVTALAGSRLKPALRTVGTGWWVWLIVVGYLLATLLVPIPRLYSLKRLVVTGWPFVVLLVGWLVAGMEGRDKGSGRWVWLALLVVSLAASLVSGRLVMKDDWRGVVAYINGQAEAGEVIWSDPVSGSFLYQYYRPVMPVYASSEMLPQPNASGIWHVAERQPGRGVPGSAAERWLDENWELVTAVSFYRLEVRYYRPE